MTDPILTPTGRARKPPRSARLRAALIDWCVRPRTATQLAADHNYPLPPLLKAMRAHIPGWKPALAEAIWAGKPIHRKWLPAWLLDPTPAQNSPRPTPIPAPTPEPPPAGPLNDIPNF